MMNTDCRRCGSAGSVEFGMCQVCYCDHSRIDKAPCGTGAAPALEGGAAGAENMLLGRARTSPVAYEREAEAVTA